MTASSPLDPDRSSERIGESLSKRGSSEGMPIEDSEYADLYNLNDIGLALRLYARWADRE